MENETGVNEMNGCGVVGEREREREREDEEGEIP